MSMSMSVCSITGCIFVGVSSARYLQYIVMDFYLISSFPLLTSALLATVD